METNSPSSSPRPSAVRKPTTNTKKKCRNVKKGSKRKNPLPTHIKTLSPGLFECTKCEKHLKTKHQLRHHKFCGSTDAQKPHKCAHCGKGFLRKYQLTYHVKSHSGEEPFPCARCGIGFTTSHTLKRHLVGVHSEGVLFPCTKCPQKFLFKNAFELHLESHSQKSEGKTTSSSQNSADDRLELVDVNSPGTDDGQIRPTGDRNVVVKDNLDPNIVMNAYQCDHCEKIFKWKGDLNRHIKTHSGEKPFACPTCGKRFPWKSYVKEHVIRVHSQKTLRRSQFVCEKCMTGFPTMNTIAKHVSSHARSQGVLLRCTVHNKNFDGLSTLEEHVRKYHKKEEEKKHRCAQCGMGFDHLSILRRHEAVHSDYRPFGCTICTSRFKRKKNLVRHMKTVHKRRKSNNLDLEAGGQNVLEEGERNVEKASVPKSSDNPTTSVSRDVRELEDVEGDAECCNGISSQGAILVCAGLNDENNSNSETSAAASTSAALLTSSSTPAASSTTSSSPDSPRPCSSSSMRTAGSIMAEERVEIPIQALFSCERCTGRFGNLEDLNRHVAVHVDAEAEEIPLQREVIAEVPDENVDESDEDDTEDQDDFFDDNSSEEPELSQAPDEVAGE